LVGWLVGWLLIVSVIRLRRDHRILGSLVGCGAKHPREEQGLPLLLSPQEIQVLKVRFTTFYLNLTLNSLITEGCSFSEGGKRFYKSYNLSF